MKRVAIIGAGLAGVALARTLNKLAEVNIFEKSRGLGGRMATRRAEDFQFDHGAQFFTARSPQFQSLLSTLDEACLRSWDARVLTLEQGKKAFKREWFETHYVAMPQMNSLAKSLAEELVVSLNTEVAAIDRAGSRWQLRDRRGAKLGEFDWIISSAPAPQTRALMPEEFSGRNALLEVEYSPCYALMLGFTSRPSVNFDAAVVRNEAVAWIAVNSRKPGRNTGFSVVAHSNHQWSRQFPDDDEALSQAMSDSLSALTDIDCTAAVHRSLHRWRYARVERDLQTDYLLDSRQQLAACGDWCLGARIEDAFLSGHRLGTRLAAIL